MNQEPGGDFPKRYRHGHLRAQGRSLWARLVGGKTGGAGQHPAGSEPREAGRQLMVSTTGAWSLVPTSESTTQSDARAATPGDAST